RVSWREVSIDDDISGLSLVMGDVLIRETERLLRTYGTDKEPHEGIVYLAGRELQGESVALCALSPSAMTSFGSFETNSDANAAVIRVLADLGLTLVGQVHSHPGEWVDHSLGDDAGAMVRFKGYWSLIVPWFARKGMLPLSRCGVHVYQDGQFSRLSAAAVRSRIRVIPASIDLRARHD